MGSSSWKQTGEGMAAMVGQLPNLLKDMIGDAPKPRVLFTVRGPGFYQGGHGGICEAYRKALDKNGFRPFAGTNASTFYTLYQLRRKSKNKESLHKRWPTSVYFLPAASLIRSSSQLPLQILYVASPHFLKRD